MRAIQLLGALSLLVLASACGDSIDFEFENRFEGRVTRILDGDTWRMDTEPIRVRAWGYDAPECVPDCENGATVKLRELITDQDLVCEWVNRQLSYERKIVRCFLPDGTDIGQAMVDSGTVLEVCRFSRGVYGTCG
ncbi:MAG: hypothetical protein AAF950_07120 [Pseudomonadota bacterium]